VNACVKVRVRAFVQVKLSFLSVLDGAVVVWFLFRGVCCSALKILSQKSFQEENFSMNPQELFRGLVTTGGSMFVSLSVVLGPRTLAR
jgi:hypothetical protein